jgi:hypothetical protein
VEMAERGDTEDQFGDDEAFTAPQALVWGG